MSRHVRTPMARCCSSSCCSSSCAIEAMQAQVRAPAVHRADALSALTLSALRGAQGKSSSDQHCA
eukprot:7185919-Prymnesium_polylepis.1